MTDVKRLRVPLVGSFLPPVEGFGVRSAPKPDEEINVSVWLRRNPDAPPLPEPPSTVPIDRATFAASWGAVQADLDAVMSYVSAFGITRIDNDPNLPTALARRLLGLKGQIAAFEEAFGVKLSVYARTNAEPYLGREGTVSIPQTLRNIVLGIFGLDERPVGLRTPSSAPKQPSCLPTPPQVADYYRFPRHTAKGQCIAVMEFGGGYDPVDIHAYFTSINVTRPTLVDVAVAGATNQPGSPYDPEVVLDIDVAGSVAEEVTLAIYFAPHTERGWVEAIASAVHDGIRKPGVMSISWGAAELGKSNTLEWSASGMAALRDSFIDAGNLGMTVLAAAGDHGSACRVYDRRAHVVYPASDPMVIGCGGTSIPDISATLETAWSRGGGGISDVFPVPAYQKGVTLPMSLNTAGFKRGVPDISGYAHPGCEFIQAGSRFRAVGTSLTAPLYAALIARVNARNAALGYGPLGYVLPYLYRLGGFIFRDIDDAESNGNSNGFAFAPGYYGSKGWDARTGLGILSSERFMEQVDKERAADRTTPVDR